MKILTPALLSALLSVPFSLLTGCATASVAQQGDTLFNDRLFAPASEKIDAKELFAINDKMRQFVHAEIADEVRIKGAPQALFDALYAKSQLRIEYDAEITRNAAEAFEVRSGNCLSMAIMTAALAKEMEISVKYKSVFVNEAWSRKGDLHLAVGHVNVTLMEKASPLHIDIRRPLTIDFLPQSEIKDHASEVIEEETIIAMYMNNRAAESLVRGKFDDAYWWAREAITQDPGFSIAYNTLGAVYRGHGNLQEAHTVFSQLLARDPSNVSVMFNLAQVLKDLGRTAESAQLAARVEQLRPYPPYHFFTLGQTAMRNGQYKEARDLFSKEVERAPESPDFNFWLAAAYFNLGDIKPAGKYMAIAMQNSTTRSEYALYAAKLNVINAKQRVEKY